ncbi:hypothetical protein NBRC10513v2_003681 [Rhodotorula toruloides]|uniref:Proteophosphoglycan ppg4 n=1 Tax=Rhodotorula toruloides TaxID=5286 RepID=A0A0K3CBM0_RHOTO|nr:hypothetical protein AAT19DRAFT_13039 [Rhodotorula toruloides]
MSAARRYTLPASPAGTNPYEYWIAVTESVQRSRPGDKIGLDVRLSILCALLAFVFLAAVANLCITVIDSRRRGKSLFLWRLVARTRGRYIVGNRQLLEPILTVITTPLLIAHVAVEWTGTLGSGDVESVGALRVTPWTLLFLQLWIVSWASLQGYIITNGEASRGLRWLSPRLANSIFLGVGLVMLAGLIVCDILAARAAVDLDAANDRLINQLRDLAPNWSGTIAPDVMTTLQAGWSKVMGYASDVFTYARALMAIYAVSPFFTALVNAACIALLIVVRQQIKENYRTFGVDTTHSALVRLPELRTTPATPGRQEELVVDFASPIGTVSDATTTQPTVSLNVIPATPRLGTESLPSTSKGGATSSAGHSIVDLSRSSTSRRSKPSRSAVRKLAGEEAGGIKAVRARNLQLLHRAELDLLITTLSSIAMAVSFSGLSLWIVIELPNFHKRRTVATEIALTLGSWLYGLIVGLTLSAHFYIAYVNLARKQADVNYSLPTSQPVTPLRDLTEYFGATWLDGAMSQPGDGSIGNPAWLSPADAQVRPEEDGRETLVEAEGSTENETKSETRSSA